MTRARGFGMLCVERTFDVCLGFFALAFGVLLDFCVFSFVSCGSPKVSDCPPTNRERELGLDRREAGLFYRSGECARELHFFRV